MVKKPKFKNFELTLIDGSKVMVKAPRSRLTEEYAALLAYHWANVSKTNVILVKGVD